MTHQVEQLKEELKQKNTQLVHQDMDFSKYVGENEKIAQDKEQAKQKIKDAEEAIKDCELNIARQKFLIS